MQEMPDPLLCSKGAPADTCSDALGRSENDHLCAQSYDDSWFYQFEALAAVAIVQDWSPRVVELYLFLYIVVGADDAPH